MSKIKLLCFFKNRDQDGEFAIGNNPWRIPPIEVIAQGWDAVEEYHNERRLERIKSATKR